MLQKRFIFFFLNYISTFIKVNAMKKNNMFLITNNIFINLPDIWVKTRVSTHRRELLEKELGKVPFLTTGVWI
jgi:hypothetical protein